MKRIVFFAYLLSLLLSSCSYTEYYENTKEPAIVTTPKLLTFSISAKDNPMQMVDDAICEIIGDSIVNCWVKNILNDKSLTAKFSYEGEEIKFDDKVVNDGTITTNFYHPVIISVLSGTHTKEYKVYVHTYTGLPVIWIETDGRQKIASKEDYLKASFKLVENAVTSGTYGIIEDSINIKGRGNSTWSLPKKPYNLKFNKKQSLFNEPKNKSWVLLANYTDKTMLRNYIAFYMGYMSNLDYTPKTHFTELMLNGQYKGTYQLCEKLKISKNRVNVGDDGFLLEIDAKANTNDVTFNVNHIGRPINIKEPDNISAGDENYNYITDFVTRAEEVLYSENFTNQNEGWQKYFDIDSFVDWYLINEITKNNDAAMWSSCYMNLERGGKLKMGPLWDFDIALGNYDNNDNFYYYGFWIKNAEWISRMFNDPIFVEKVKERFNYFYSKKEDIMQEINEKAQYLRYSVQENERCWHTFYSYTWPNYDIWGSYQNEVQHMKEWFNSRFEWLKTEFEKM